MTTSSDGSPQSLRERGDPLVSARNISRSSSATWQRTLTKKMVDGMSKNIHRARTSLSSMVGFGMAPEAASAHTENIPPRRSETPSSLEWISRHSPSRKLPATLRSRRVIAGSQQPPLVSDPGGSLKFSSSPSHESSSFKSPTDGCSISSKLENRKSLSLFATLSHSSRPSFANASPLLGNLPSKSNSTDVPQDPANISQDHAGNTSDHSDPIDIPSPAPALAIQIPDGHLSFGSEDVNTFVVGTAPQSPAPIAGDVPPTLVYSTQSSPSPSGTHKMMPGSFPEDIPRRQLSSIERVDATESQQNGVGHTGTQFNAGWLITEGTSQQSRDLSNSMMDRPRYGLVRLSPYRPRESLSRPERLYRSAATYRSTSSQTDRTQFEQPDRQPAEPFQVPIGFDNWFPNNNTHRSWSSQSSQSSSRSPSQVLAAERHTKLAKDELDSYNSEAVIQHFERHGSRNPYSTILAVRRQYELSAHAGRENSAETIAYRDILAQVYYCFGQNPPWENHPKDSLKAELVWRSLMNTLIYEDWKFDQPNLPSVNVDFDEPKDGKASANNAASGEKDKQQTCSPEVASSLDQADTWEDMFQKALNLGVAISSVDQLHRYVEEELIPPIPIFDCLRKQQVAWKVEYQRLLDALNNDELQGKKSPMHTRSNTCQFIIKHYDVNSRIPVLIDQLKGKQAIDDGMELTVCEPDPDPSCRVEKTSFEIPDAQPGRSEANLEPVQTTSPAKFASTSPPPGKHALPSYEEAINGRDEIIQACRIVDIPGRINDPPSPRPTFDQLTKVVSSFEVPEVDYDSNVKYFVWAPTGVLFTRKELGNINYMEQHLFADLYPSWQKRYEKEWEQLPAEEKDLFDNKFFWYKWVECRKYIRNLFIKNKQQVDQEYLARKAAKNAEDFPNPKEGSGPVLATTHPAKLRRSESFDSLYDVSPGVKPIRQSNIDVPENLKLSDSSSSAGAQSAADSMPAVTACDTHAPLTKPAGRTSSVYSDTPNSHCIAPKKHTTSVREDSVPGSLRSVTASDAEMPSSRSLWELYNSTSQRLSRARFDDQPEEQRALWVQRGRLIHNIRARGGDSQTQFTLRSESMEKDVKETDGVDETADEHLQPPTPVIRATQPPAGSSPFHLPAVQSPDSAAQGATSRASSDISSNPLDASSSECARPTVSSSSSRSVSDTIQHHADVNDDHLGPIDCLPRDENSLEFQEWDYITTNISPGWTFVDTDGSSEE